MPSPDVASLLASLDDQDVTPETVLRVRKAIYTHDQLTASDMDLVFSVARKATCQPCPEWTNLFCEALTDYVVHQNDPPDYIPQNKADWLTATLANNGGICSRTEFDMLIDVMTHALGVPTSLSTFALNEIKTAIMSGRRGAITGEDHPPGVVTKADVEALRAVLYAATTGTADHVTRDEAEVLFEIAHITSQHATSQADPSFDDLFARAISNYLMAISVHAPDAAEALHFEKWLDTKEDLKEGVVEYLENFARGLLHGGLQAKSSFNLLESPEQAYEDDMAVQDAIDEGLRDESEKITGPEAAWVIAHLTRDGELSSAEKRLLQFLGMEAPSIAPPLQTLIKKENAATSLTFGRRESSQLPAPQD